VRSEKKLSVFLFEENTGSLFYPTAADYNFLWGRLSH